MNNLNITAFFNSLTQAEEVSTQLRTLGAEKLNLIQYDVNDEQGEGNMSDLNADGAFIAANQNQGSGNAFGGGGGILALNYVSAVTSNDAGAESYAGTETILEGVVPEDKMDKAREIIEEHDGRL
jgi:hypothetical protein